MEEFKNFLAHYQAIIQNGENVKINIKYDKGKLVLFSESINCTIKRVFECSKQTYTSIIELFYSLLIQENKLYYASIGNNNKFTLKSETISLQSDIVNEENKKIAQKLIKITFDKIKTNNIGTKREINMCQNIKKYIENFLNFLKTNSTNNNFKVFLFFKNSKFNVLIKNDNDIIYEFSLGCDEQQFKNMAKTILQEFINNNIIISSSFGPVRYTCFDEQFHGKYTDQMLQIKSKEATIMTIYDDELNSIHENALIKMNEVKFNPYVKVNTLAQKL